MRQSLNELRHYKVETNDGELGDIKDFLFDDRDWIIRYLVVDTGGWLTDRKVLVSPVAVEALDPDEERMHLTISKQQLEDSPGLGDNQPVSRQIEARLAEYYTWPVYWGPQAIVGPPAVAENLRASGAPERQVQQSPAQVQRENPALRSIGEVLGYHIAATDGEIGHVEDFLADPATWEIRLMVVDTRNWLPGRKVLVSPSWIQQVEWRTAHVVVEVEREAIRAAPEYEPGAPVTPEAERELYDYYGQAYW